MCLLPANAKLTVSVQLNEQSHIRVHRTKRGGAEYINLRVFNMNDCGEFVSTKKGIAIPANHLSTIIWALGKMVREG